MLVTVLKAIAFVTFLGITVGRMRSPIEDNEVLKEKEKHLEEICLEENKES